MLSLRIMLILVAAGVVSCTRAIGLGPFEGSPSSGSYLVVVVDRDNREARIAMMSAFVAVRDQSGDGSKTVTFYDMRNDVLCVESENLADLRRTITGSMPSGPLTALHEIPGQSCDDAVPRVTGREWKALELIPTERPS